MKIKLYNPLSILLLLFSIVSANEDTIFHEPRDILQWKDVRFQEYDKDESTYVKFFVPLKKDMQESGINIQNDSDRVRFFNYVVVRDAWLHAKNMYNYKMAILLTRLLLALVDEKNGLTRDNKDSFSLSVQWEKCYHKAFVDKKILFAKLDEINVEKNKKWKDLNAFEQGIVDRSGRTSGWMHYIKQCGLRYVDFDSTSTYFLFKCVNDTEYTNVLCLTEDIKFSSIPKTMQFSSFIIDYGERIRLQHELLKKNNGIFERNTAIQYIRDQSHKYNKKWLYFYTENDPFANSRKFLSLRKDIITFWECI